MGDGAARLAQNRRGLADRSNMSSALRVFRPTDLAAATRRFANRLRSGYFIGASDMSPQPCKTQVVSECYRARNSISRRRSSFLARI